MMNRVRTYLDVIESMCEKDIDLCVGIMPTECGMGVRKRIEIAAGMNRYRHIIDNVIESEKNSQNDMKIVDAEAMEAPESAKFLVRNITPN